MMTLNHLRAEEVIFAHIQSLQTTRTTNDIQESLKLITITDAIYKNLRTLISIINFTFQKNDCFFPLV
jgi:hypothetical protein